MTKSDFVRSQSGKPAKEVVALAAKRAMKLTERYVYVIRSADKAKARHAWRNGGTLRKGVTVTVDKDAERGLRQAIAELGLTQSRKILNEVERAFAG